MLMPLPAMIEPKKPLAMFRCPNASLATANAAPQPTAADSPMCTSDHTERK
jgi:hypothetical protein